MDSTTYTHDDPSNRDYGEQILQYLKTMYRSHRSTKTFIYLY